MKKILFILLCSIMGASGISAQTKVDTVKVQLRIKELKQSEVTLKKRIETEDKKRNQNIDGVSEISMNDINERQDSICLDLRSQLVDLQLQVKELEVSIQSTATLTSEEAAANLHQGLSTLSPAANSNPGKPTKPTKPSKKTKK